MMAIALSLLACAVFAALTVVAVTAALNSARIDDIIGEVFSPWIEDPFAEPGTAQASAARSPAVEAGPAGDTTAPDVRRTVPARA